MTIEIISLSISTDAWDRAGIELVTPRSVVRQYLQPDRLTTGLCGPVSTLFAYLNMISDPTLVNLTSNFYVLCTNVKVYLYNYS